MKNLLHILTVEVSDKKETLPESRSVANIRASIKNGYTSLYNANSVRQNYGHTFDLKAASSSAWSITDNLVSKLIDQASVLIPLSSYPREPSIFTQMPLLSTFLNP